jgi:hypothetical protein
MRLNTRSQTAAAANARRPQLVVELRTKSHRAGKKVHRLIKTSQKQKSHYYRQQKRKSREPLTNSLVVFEEEEEGK